jgi:hypothetical protein
MTHRTLVLLIGGVLLAACQTQSQVLDTKQATATDVALQRGKFDLNCPAAQASVLSRQYIQAPGPMIANTVTRTEYTVGVSGCNQRATYLVVCSEGTQGCIAGGRQ